MKVISELKVNIDKHFAKNVVTINEEKITKVMNAIGKPV